MAVTGYVAGERPGPPGCGPTKTPNSLDLGLVELLTDDIYMDVTEIETDPLTGIDYYRTSVLTINSDTIQGQLIMKPTRELGRWLFPPRSGYVRYICDCETKLNVFGKKVDTTVVMTNELMFMQNRE